MGDEARRAAASRRDTNGTASLGYSRVLWGTLGHSGVPQGDSSRYLAVHRPVLALVHAEREQRHAVDADVRQRRASRRRLLHELHERVRTRVGLQAMRARQPHACTLTPVRHRIRRACVRECVRAHLVPVCMIRECGASSSAGRTRFPARSLYIWSPHHTPQSTRRKRGAPAHALPRWMDGRPGAAQPTKADGVGVRSSPARCNALPTVATHRHTLQRHHTTLQRSTTRCNAARRSARVAPADLPVEKVVGGLDEERAARGLGVGDVQRDCAGTHTAAECGSTGIDAQRARG